MEHWRWTQHENGQVSVEIWESVPDSRPVRYKYTICSDIAYERMRKFVELLKGELDGKDPDGNRVASLD